MDRTEARDLRPVEERPDQCDNTGISSGGRTVVPVVLHGPQGAVGGGSGPKGAAAPIHRRSSDGTLGDGRRWSLPCHLDGEPILPHGGMLLFEIARVPPHPGSEGHDGIFPSPLWRSGSWCESP